MMGTFTNVGRKERAVMERSDRILLAIQGMTCGHCQGRVERALRAVSGVTEVEVDLAAGRASIRGNADAEALVAASTEAGYPARVIE